MKQKRILLIDDSEFNLESTSTLLQFKGYEVITASRGESGVELAVKEIPDLIICDVSMPGMSGYEVVEKIRANKITMNIPFIFLTAYADKSKRREGMEKGADDYLTKPYTKEELFAAIDVQWKKFGNIETKVHEKIETVNRNLSYALPHEFRTVLSQLTSYAYHFQHEAGDINKEDMIDMATDMINSIARLTKITDNFLLFIKLELMADSKDSISQLRARKTVEPCVALEDIVAFACDRNSRFGDVEIKHSINDITVAMGTDLFFNATNELVDNALKFSKSGSKVTIDAELTKDNLLKIVISDTGIGMTHEQISNVGAYMQFQRDSYEQQGVGIGLTIAKRIIEMHGGTFKIESEKNIGTSIVFTIPIAKE